MKEKLITKQDLASFDNRIQETLEYYQDEVSQLKEKIAQKEAEIALLAEQLKEALDIESGIGFAN